MRRLTNVKDRKINNRKSLVDLQIDTMDWGAKPLYSLTELLIDEVMNYHCDEDNAPIESDKLFYLAYELRNYAAELKEALELCFLSAFDLIPSDPTDKKEVCNESENN